MALFCCAEPVIWSGKAYLRAMSHTSPVARIEAIATASPPTDVEGDYQHWASAKLSDPRDARLFARMAERSSDASVPCWAGSAARTIPGTARADATDRLRATFRSRAGRVKEAARTGSPMTDIPLLPVLQSNRSGAIDLLAHRVQTREIA